MTGPVSAPPRPVAVDELRRAWHAIQDGQFRARPGVRPVQRRPAPSRWEPAEPVIPVVGCLPQAGATTVALAIATVFGRARVVECCSATSSGLAAAPLAELGVTENGWAFGRRGEVTIARSRDAHVGLAGRPLPDPIDSVGLTVLDVGSDLGEVLAADSWVGEQVAGPAPIVLASTATIPGMRRLETALSQLGARRSVATVLGPPGRRWSAAVAAALGPAGRALDRTSRLVTVPVDRRLAVRGIDSTPLPTAVLAAARTVLGHVGPQAQEKGRS